MTECARLVLSEGDAGIGNDEDLPLGGGRRCPLGPRADRLAAVACREMIDAAFEPICCELAPFIGTHSRRLAA